MKCKTAVLIFVVLLLSSSIGAIAYHYVQTNNGENNTHEDKDDNSIPKPKEGEQMTTYTGYSDGLIYDYTGTTLTITNPSGGAGIIKDMYTGKLKSNGSGSYAADFSGMTTLVLNSGVVAIGAGLSSQSTGYNAFSGCTSLSTVSLPNTLYRIGEGAFNGDTGLTSITLPDSVTEIGERAFYNAGLTSIYLPDSVGSIRSQAFSNCGSLSSVRLPRHAAVFTISSASVFANCPNITTMEIPSEITYIPENFMYLGNASQSQLVEVSIYGDVTYIGSYAFYTKSGVRYVFYGSAPSGVQSRAFINPEVYRHGTWTSTNITSVESLYHQLYYIDFNTSGNVVREYQKEGFATTLPSISPPAHYYATGWWSAPSGGTKYGDVGQQYTFTSDTTAYAQWSNNYTATIAVSPSGYGSVSPTSITKAYNSAISNSGATVTVGGTTSTATPAAQTAQYTYAFSSWTNGTGNLTADRTITANFTRSTRNYTATIAVSPSGYGTVSPTSITKAYNSAISNSGATVTVGDTTSTATPAATTAQYTYAFSSWTNGTGNLTADRTITANFTRTTRTYTVTWKNWDNTTLETDTGVAYGTTPTYNSATPTRASTAQYSYTFSGWSPAVGAITGATTYTAQFTPALRSYSITLNKVGHGSVSGGGTYDYGTSATITATAEAGYSFVQWSDGDTNASRSITVTGAVTLTAYFTLRVRWYNGSTLLETDTNVIPSPLSSSTTPTYNGATPTKASTAQYVYTFSGWSPAVAKISADTDYSAQFSSSIRKYTVTWKNYDNSTLETDQNVPYGTVPTYNSSTPTKASTAQEMYTFSGWNPTVAAITGDTVYTAQFTATSLYTIEWKNWNGELLEIDPNVPAGSTPTYNGATPTRSSTAQYSYTFSGWSPVIGPVSGNTIYTAQYTSTARLYQVTVQSSNTDYGTVSPTNITVPYGTTFSTSGNTLTIDSTTFTATPSSATAAQTYLFDSWSATSGTITGPTTITAVFVPTVNAYTLTLTSNGNGTVIGAGVYEYGTEVEISTVPDIGYVFDKWSDGNTNATRTITVNTDISLSATFKWGAPLIKMFVNINGTWIPLTSSNEPYNTGGQ